MHIEFQALTTPESLQLIRDVAAEVWPKTFEKILSSEQISYMMDMMYAPEVMNKELADNMYFELLRIDSEPAGYMVYSAYNHSSQTAKLHKLYLKHAFHGIALGQKMLDHVQTQCRKLGFSELILAVNKQNERAIKAYKRNGFATFESVCNPIGNGFFMDDYLMKKSL
ncbi:MAG: GNAT family N-acetyltransferase [Lentisphaerae bacterium]|nr:GNAT family N-acetyltransferase [Lentisphaerota bacterium]